jgi:hypothetical protein
MTSSITARVVAKHADRLGRESKKYDEFIKVSNELRDERLECEDHAQYAKMVQSHELQLTRLAKELGLV